MAGQTLRFLLLQGRSDPQLLELGLQTAPASLRDRGVPGQQPSTDRSLPGRAAVLGSDRRHGTAGDDLAGEVPQVLHAGCADPAHGLRRRRSSGTSPRPQVRHPTPLRRGLRT